MKKKFIAIGLMSGTSMDGIDLAMIESDGENYVKNLGHDYLAFLPDFKQKLRDLIGLKPSLLQIKQVENELTELHAQLVNSFLAKEKISAEAIDLIGFHGQTIFHAPAQKITWQLGNAALLAHETKIKVIADFRMQDVVQGGQGAPLVPIYHRALFSGFISNSVSGSVNGQNEQKNSSKISEIYQSYLKLRQKLLWYIRGPHDCEAADRSANFKIYRSPLDLGISEISKRGIVVLNVGGISNLTYFNQSLNSLTAFDCCFGNAPSDDFMLQKFGLDFDENGKIAASGKPDKKLVELILSHEIFNQKPPKSYHRSDFDAVLNPLKELNESDYLASLWLIFAKALRRNFEFLNILSAKIMPAAVFVCGGGRQNQALMNFLKQEIAEAEIFNTDDFGFDGSKIEAQAFGYLAIRRALNLPNSFAGTTGVKYSENSIGCLGGVIYPAKFL